VSEREREKKRDEKAMELMRGKGEKKEIKWLSEEKRGVEKERKQLHWDRQKSCVFVSLKKNTW
jgi:hypothetical protein